MNFLKVNIWITIIQAKKYNIFSSTEAQSPKNDHYLDFKHHELVLLGFKLYIYTVE